MKKSTFLRVFALSLFAVILMYGLAIAKDSAKYKECSIMTNAHCSSCKAKIEKGLKAENGVKNADVNLDTKVALITYDASKTNATELTKKVSDLGYTAELVKDGKCADGKTCTAAEKANCPTGGKCCGGHGTTPGTK